MVDSITLNIVGQNNNTKPGTILTESATFINSIITVGENNTITEKDFKVLQNVAAKSGDAGILENSDLNGQQKMALANIYKFNEYYDISLSNDGKYFQVKIKEYKATLTTKTNSIFHTLLTILFCELICIVLFFNQRFYVLYFFFYLLVFWCNFFCFSQYKKLVFIWGISLFRQPH